MQYLAPNVHSECYYFKVIYYFFYFYYLHMVQLMPVPIISSCLVKIQYGFAFLGPA